MIERKSKILYLFLILILLIGVSLFWKTFFSQERKRGEGNVILIPIEERFPSEKAEKFSITGNSKNYPSFYKELIIDPAASPNLYKIKKGERQTYSIWVRGNQEIKKVVALIRTNSKQEIVDLKLVEGDLKEGRWQGSWIVYDVSPNSKYMTTLEAVDIAGNKTSITIPWYTGGW